jgi:hypothetical protein
MNTPLRPSRLFFPVLLFLASAPLVSADDWWVHAQLTDRHSTDGTQHVIDESNQVSNQGQTVDYRDTFDQRADGSTVDSQSTTGNGSVDSSGWHNDGGSWTHTHDTITDRDGSRVEHDVITTTDKNGNSETWENVSTYDSKGRKTSDNSLHDYKPRGKPPRKE